MAKKPAAQKGKPWTDPEDQKILELLGNKPPATYKEIAEALGRTELAVEFRILDIVSRAKQADNTIEAIAAATHLPVETINNVEEIIANASATKKKMMKKEGKKAEQRDIERDELKTIVIEQQKKIDDMSVLLQKIAAKFQIE